MDKQKLSVGESASLSITVTNPKYLIKYVRIDLYEDVTLSLRSQGTIDSITRTDAIHPPVVAVYLQKAAIGEFENISLKSTNEAYNFDFIELTITPLIDESSPNDHFYWNWGAINSQNGGSKTIVIKNYDIISTAKDEKLNPKLSMTYLRQLANNIDGIEFDVKMRVRIGKTIYANTQIYITNAISYNSKLKKWFTLIIETDSKDQLQGTIELMIDFSSFNDPSLIG